MSSNRDIVMSPPARKVITARKLSIDPKKDYSTPLLVETSVEYDLPPHIYPPKGATPILMLHPAYGSTSSLSGSPMSKPSLSERKYDQYAYTVLPDYRTKIPDTKASCRKHKCECDACCNAVARKVSRSSAKVTVNAKNKMPLGDAVSNSLLDTRPPPPMYKPWTQKSTLYSAIENHLLLPEEAEFKMRMQQQQQLNIQVPNGFSNETTLWNPAVVPQTCDPFTAAMGVTPKCQYGCCNNLVPSRAAEFLAPGIPPSLVIRTPGRSAAASSPKVRARSRRAVNAVNSVPDYFSASRPLRSLTSGGPNLQSGLNHQRSRSNIALYSSSQSQQLSSSLTPKPVLNQMPISLTQTIPSSSTVCPCRDSGCSIGTDTYSANLSSGKHFTQTLDRVSLGADSGFNTPGDSPFDVHMESNDANNNCGALYTRSNPLANNYSSLMNPTYAHLINLQNTLNPSVLPRYHVNSPILQPYYIREPLLNLAY